MGDINNHSDRCRRDHMEEAPLRLRADPQWKHRYSEQSQ